MKSIYKINNKRVLQRGKRTSFINMVSIKCSYNDMAHVPLMKYEISERLIPFILLNIVQETYISDTNLMLSDTDYLNHQTGDFPRPPADSLGVAHVKKKNGDSTKNTWFIHDQCMPGNVIFCERLRIIFIF